MPQTPRKVRFANATEEEFAALLRSLRIRWEYEPHMFVLRTRPDGSPALAFTPDFYLPDLQVYLELTTMRQKLVTLKNRKARLLREQRPDVRLRVLYRRDCQELLRPRRSPESREAMLRSLLSEPTPEALRRARWLLRLVRTGDRGGAVSVLGVRLPLGPEWSGRRVRVWIYAGVLEVEFQDRVAARFPCTYVAATRSFLSVLPGEVLSAPEYEQGRLAVPELERRPGLGRRGRRSGRLANSIQLALFT